MRGAEPAPGDGFVEMLEHAPITALLLDADGRVVRANAAARDFFAIDPNRLPASVVEVTLESRLFEIVNAGEAEATVNLVHHRRTAQAHLVPGPDAGQRILFLSDVTELRRLATVRQEFVANLVHELKTPITSLRLTAESLLLEPAARDRARFAGRLVREADLMSRIIDNLRQLAELESGVLTVQPSGFDVVELIEELRPRAGDTHPLRLDAPESLHVTTDRAKLAQAI